jgi:hypothetical protein
MIAVKRGQVSLNENKIKARTPPPPHTHTDSVICLNRSDF